MIKDLKGTLRMTQRSISIKT